MDATGPPDARELATFSELEGKLVDASRRVKSVRREWGWSEREREEQSMKQTILSRKGSSRAKTKTQPLFFPFETKTKQQAEQTAVSAIQAGRRAALTKAEIDAAPEEARTWATVGRA